MSSNEVVAAYKSLAKVERAFRSLKTVDLHLRPIYHHKDGRTLAYYGSFEKKCRTSPTRKRGRKPQKTLQIQSLARASG